MPSGLPALSSFSSSLGSLVRNGLPLLVVAVLGAAGGADHLLGRDAVDLLGVHPHEVLAAAGDDVGLVAVFAEVFQHFLHRQVGELGIGPLPARVFGRFEPLLHLGVERRPTDMPVSVAARILSKVIHRELRHRRAVAGQHRLEGLDILELRFRLDHRCQPAPGSTSPASTSGARPTACRPGRTWRCARQVATNFGLPGVVVACTNSTIVCLAGPSFQEGSGSVSACARTPMARRAPIAKTRARLKNKETGFMDGFL